MFSVPETHWLKGLVLLGGCFPPSQMITVGPFGLSELCLWEIISQGAESHLKKSSLMCTLPEPVQLVPGRLVVL